jgi:hypothetical protein
MFSILYFLLVQDLISNKGVYLVDNIEVSMSRKEWDSPDFEPNRPKIYSIFNMVV